MVRILFERRAFDAAASDLVSSLFVCYVSGSIIYLSRDVLVRVFYALGDGKPPFYTSIIAIAANAILDWIAVRRLGYGAQGLVLATLSVNFLSVIILLGMLSRKLQGLKLADCVRPLCVLTGVAASTAFVTRAVYDSALRLSTLLLAKREISRQILPLMLELTSLGVAAMSGILVFFTIVLSLRLQEIESLLPRRMRRA
ncbi:hypothetical protein CBR_g41472 [Chara braunii]|uniref:Polysaccharide biosynthesis protein C-terminal domain-containing protein n=1 Tax=Chara braunii TaxID=69332 RepID=A0A388LVW8_CHABU|nr:hypothetical protein CBR_g41472 [Chara braunii]|eukprot:GBG86477.1 hypothetical protein CBR_g41472 [Chara braunii]